MQNFLKALACITMVCSCQKKNSTNDVDTSSPYETNSGRIVITSENEPKSDKDALKIVGISNVMHLEVLHRTYEAGLDDNMRMVIRFPSSSLKQFWKASPWKEALPEKPQFISLPKKGNKKWSQWQSYTKGIYTQAELPNGENAVIYLVKDLEGDFIRGFIFWHQT